MKKTILYALCMILSMGVRAQEDLNKDDRESIRKAREDAEANIDSSKIWTTGGVFQLNFSQVQLVNWSAGGVSSVSGLAQLNGWANKRKGKWAWDNSLILAYGLLAEQDKRSTKTDDRFELNSRLGREIGGPWFASALFQFRSQFVEGFDADIDTLKISNFLAPGYVLFGLGFDYKPSKKFSAYLSPIMTKTTLVYDQDLADAGAFGVDPGVFEITDIGDTTGFTQGKNVLFQMGAYANVFFTTDIAKNINFMTRLELFSNYLDNPQNIDVNWETLWTFKVNDWFAATLNTLLIYDDDIDILQKQDDGTFKTGPTTQFKQTLSIGLTAKF
ncbi:MAG: DUF3078 domain-containing protein [Flavobacteriales bacterium]|nr:DUF3078 domain-containing protein [Flavobacteriales bacterium]